MEGTLSLISPAELYGRLGTASAPAVIDVRRPSDFATTSELIISAYHRDPDKVEQRRKELPRGRQVVVHCVHGREVSQGVAAALRAAGVDAAYLQDGISGWIAKGHGAAIRGLHGGIPRSRLARTDDGRNARRLARDLGHVHPVLSLDFPRGALCRDTARQQGAQRRALRHHRGGGRRGFEPRHRDPQRVSHPLSFDAPNFVSVDLWALVL